MRVSFFIHTSSSSSVLLSSTLAALSSLRNAGPCEGQCFHSGWCQLQSGPICCEMCAAVRPEGSGGGGCCRSEVTDVAYSSALPSNALVAALAAIV